jgi:hypothetical protein
MDTSTWLESIVGAVDDAIAKPPFAANAPGDEYNPESREAVVVKIMIESAMTTITLRLIRRMAPPP